MDKYKKYKTFYLIYFVLYLTVITEVLLVIVERDEAQEKLKNSYQHMSFDLAKSFEKEVLLSIPNRISNYNIKKNDSLVQVITPIGLVTNPEKLTSELIIKPAPKKNQSYIGWPQKKGEYVPISSKDTTTFTKNFYITKENGNYYFTTKFLKNKTKEGNYKFSVLHKFKPGLPEYLALDQKDSLITWLNDSTKIHIKNKDRINFNNIFIVSKDSIEINVNKGKGQNDSDISFD